MSTATRLSSLAIATVASVAVSSSVFAQTTDAPAPAGIVIAEPEPASDGFGNWGLDLTARDSTVRPGADFYAYADGHWLATHSIPPDRASWNSFTMLAVDAERKAQGIIQSLPVGAVKGSLEQKIGDYYRAYVDQIEIDRRGLTPAETALAEIDAANTYEKIATLMGRPDLMLQSPISFGITIDEKNPDRYIVGMTQSGLGLPQRDYYLSNDPKFVEIRAKYQAHIARMLALASADHSQDAAARGARAVIDVETRIAELHWPIEKRRERELTYNLLKRDALVSSAPNFPWQSFLGAAGVGGEPEYLIAELDAVQNLAKSYTQVPIANWKVYLRYHYLAGVASVLPKPLDEEKFAFYGRVLQGQPQQRERWKRAVQATNDALGEAVGQLYVAKYFSPAAKQQMLELVENLRKAYRERMQTVSWMTDQTKVNAQKKLQTFRPKIAFPNRWRDYSSLDVQPADAFGNLVRAAVFEWRRELARLHQKTDRDEWDMTPQTVNAYYNPTFNEIVFPAAILQPPFFDPAADPAVNYGAIGAVIGHEMGHGFDDQGAKSDENGVLRTWWRPEDETAFKILGDRLAGQYDRYSPLPGLKLNGRLTLGENLGDLGGVNVALAAYHLSLHGQPAPVRDGLTGDQRFFLAYAQVWRNLERDESLRTQIMSDPHSPPKFRVNGIVRNVDAWYDAFHVTPSDPLYLPPSERVHIW